MECINKLSDMIDETQIIDILNKYRDKYQGLAESYETKIIESDNDKDENILGYDWINFEQKSSDDYIKMDKSMGSNGNCYICGKHLISLVKFNKLSQELNIDNNKLYFLQTKEYDNENDNSNVIYTKLDGYT